MKTKEFVEMEKRLLPNLPGFTIKGPMLFISPVGNLLRGFYFESSAFAQKSFYINVFFLPLYVPTKNIHFTFGHRVGRERRWTADQPGIETSLTSEIQKELSFLTGLKTIADVVAALRAFTTPNEAGYVNPHCYEALAYSLIKVGETKNALGVINLLVKRANPAVAWEAEIAQRVQLIGSKLLEKPDEVQARLSAWETDTARNLGIETSTPLAPSDGSHC
jgi:hypothetical protein